MRSLPERGAGSSAANRAAPRRGHLPSRAGGEPVESAVLRVPSGPPAADPAHRLATQLRQAREARTLYARRWGLRCVRSLGVPRLSEEGGPESKGGFPGGLDPAARGEGPAFNPLQAPGRGPRGSWLRLWASGWRV